MQNLSNPDNNSDGDIENAITAEGLTKTYQASGNQSEKKALKSVDLEIPRGMIFGLLGPNGAGKSTFINILAGLVIKSSGKASVWGFDIDENPRMARASIGVVPQEINFDPFFTPLESLDLQAGLYGVKAKQRRSMEILETLGLGDKANAYSRTLSGGMRRRLLIAKALVHQPPILVLDEPTAGVDIELRHQLWTYVRALNEQGVTIVLTTHYLEEAQALCDRIAIIDHGDLVICDDTPKLLSLLDSKTLLLRPDTTLSEVPAGLESYHTTLQSDDRLALTFNPREKTALQVLDDVRQKNISITDLETEGTNLEDVFMKLTGNQTTPPNQAG